MKFKEEDKVKVLRKATIGENGWLANWDFIMNNAVGLTGTIRYSCENGVTQYKLDFGEDDANRLDFWYPGFVLELIDTPEVPVCKFKVGDDVRIIRTALIGEHGHCFWDDEYSSEVGKIGKIASVGTNEPVKGEPCGVSYYVSGPGWHIPEQCLELVSDVSPDPETNKVENSQTEEDDTVLVRLNNAIGVLQYLNDCSIEIKLDTAKALLLYVVGVDEICITVDTK